MAPSRQSFAAACAYGVLALLMTWPLVWGLGRQLPFDLGDPLLNCWILQWDAGHLQRLLRGQWSAGVDVWNATIFHPEPLALAYSEHLLPQAVQALPVYALTGNIVLSYNLLFLSTFALSGLGTFLLVRQLTGNAAAGFVAGLFYAFAPYRLSQLGHLQVLSSQWMPFALYGLRRYFDAVTEGRSGGGGRAGTRLPLAGAGTALVLQGLSCGYFLMYFPPFAAAYALWEIGARGLWRDRRTWTQLAATAAAVCAATLPFLVPYLRLRQRGFGPRPLPELGAFSADATTYLAATDGLWLWPGGFTPPLNTEALLFPGFTPAVLAAAAVACLAVGAWRRARSGGAAPLRGWRLALAIPAALAGLAALGLLRFELFAGRRVWRVREAAPFLANITHVVAIVVVSLVILLLLSERARAAARLAVRSGGALFAAAFLAAAYLSFGPYVMTRHHGLSGPTLYAWLYQHVPGFDGLRVPARFGMLAMLFLAVLAGYGVAALLQRTGHGVAATREGPGDNVAATRERPGDNVAVSREGQGDRVAATRDRPPLQASRRADAPERRRPCRWMALTVLLAGFFLLEATGAPIDVASLEWKRRDQAGVVRVEDLERVYSYLRTLPSDTVVAEFPFGDIPLGETRAVFLATRHGHPIVNGYSGGFPASYEARRLVLQDPVASGPHAWRALVDSGATCLVVHEWAFQPGGGRALSQWLETQGAVPLAAFQGTRLYQVPRSAP